MESPPSSKRPSAWPVLAAYLAAFALTLCASAVLVFGVAWARSSGQRSHIQAEATRFALSASGLVAVAFVDAAVLLAVALLAARLGMSSVVDALRLGKGRATPTGFAAALIGMAALSFASGTTTDLLGVRDGGVMDILARELHSPSPFRFVLDVLAIGVAPGIAEETFFRGFVQTRLKARWGPIPAIVATSVAFGLIHLDPIQGTVAFIAGLFLGWMADRFGSIRPTIFAHSFNNAIFVLLAAFGAAEGSNRSAEIATIAASTAFWLLSLVVLSSPKSIQRNSNAA